MTSIPYPITKILLPYDGSPAARNALQLAAHLSLAGRENVRQVTLLQIVGGSYLARHIHNVDLRVTRMDQVKEWQRIRQRHLDQDVKPVLEEGKQILLSLGVQAPIEVRISEGKISDEIIRLAREEAYSTIVMGQRGLSPFKALLLGSVTRRVLSLAQGVAVYVAGHEMMPKAGCPISPLLLPVDGSEFSLAAVRQAAALTQAFRTMEPRLTLFHVIDIAYVETNIHEGFNDLVQEGERILAASRLILEDAGLQGFWEEKLVGGLPAEAIVRQAEEGAYPLILMGSKGRSGLGKILLGSVTSSVVQTASRSSVAVVYT